jgi:Protein of unknown function (DUF3102)
MKRKTMALVTNGNARLDHYAAVITDALTKTVEGIFDTGRLLTDARDELGNGEWGRLFDEHRVPFSIDTAQRFMRIWKARDRLLGEQKTAKLRFLPASYSTLYALAELPEDTLAWAQAEGKITADMKGSHVTQLRHVFTNVQLDASRSKRSITTPGSKLLSQVERLIGDKMKLLTPEDRSYVVTMLRQLLDRYDETSGTSNE